MVDVPALKRWAKASRFRPVFEVGYRFLCRGQDILECRGSASRSSHRVFPWRAIKPAVTNRLAIPAKNSNGCAGSASNGSAVRDAAADGPARGPEETAVARKLQKFKKFLIVSTMVPFTRGGDRYMVSSLRDRLREWGYQVDSLLLPFSEDWRDIPKQLIALKMLRVESYGDRLITIRTPSYILNHPNKVCWFIHHHRGAFDLWNSPLRDLPDTPEGLAVRRLLAQSDNQGLTSSRRVYANSQVVADRLERFNQIKAPVLYPPLKSTEGLRCDRYGDYFFYPSRIAFIKRQELAVDAMRRVKSGVKLVIAGRPDSPQDSERMRRAVARSGAEDRITVLDHFISEQEKQDLMANALGCLYFPINEDSYGYVGLEASHSEKAIITMSDAGGVLELVVHGRNGLVVNPDAGSLAEAMDQLYEDRALAERMGAAARQRIDELEISWGRVIEAIVT